MQYSQKTNVIVTAITEVNMKKFALIILAFISFPAKAFPQNLQQTEMTTYGNARFEYVIDFPSKLLIAQPEADNGDGRIFTSKDKNAKMTVFASFNALEEKLETHANDAKKHCNNKQSYFTLKHDMFAISCKINSKIFYQKTFFKNDTFYNFYIEYPISQQKTWDKIASKISASFKVQ